MSLYLVYPAIFRSRSCMQPNTTSANPSHQALQPEWTICNRLASSLFACCRLSRALGGRGAARNPCCNPLDPCCFTLLPGGLRRRRWAGLGGCTSRRVCRVGVWPHPRKRGWALLLLLCPAAITHSNRISAPLRNLPSLLKVHRHSQ